LVDNQGNTSISRSTRATTVGQHLIEAVEPLDANDWRIRIGTDSSIHQTSKGSITASGEGSVSYHQFSLADDTQLRITYMEADFPVNLRIYRYDGGSFGSLISSYTSSVGEPRLTLTLSDGDYILAVAAYYLSAFEATNGRNTTNYSGTYSLRMDTVDTWPTTDPTRNMGFDGLFVDLDMDDPDNPLYPIKSSADESLVIGTTDDLSGYVGKTLIGEHTFETLTIRNGGYVDFGEDRVVVIDSAASTVPSDRITVGELILQ
jgi:hypothetical protein